MLVAAAILYLSLASGSGLPQTNLHIPNGDKLVHICMYFGLALVLTGDLHRAVCAQQGKIVRSLTFRWLYVLLAFGLPIAYGGCIELIQPFFPPRTAEWLDFVSDAAGAVFGFVAGDKIFPAILRK